MLSFKHCKMLPRVPGSIDWSWLTNKLFIKTNISAIFHWCKRNYQIFIFDAYIYIWYKYIFIYILFFHNFFYNSRSNRMVNRGSFDDFYRMFIYYESLFTEVGVQLVKDQLVTMWVSFEPVSNRFHKLVPN